MYFNFFHHAPLGNQFVLKGLACLNKVLSTYLPIRAADRKFLHFIWRDELYEFTCLPNRLACASRQFTKTLKPVIANLHKMGHISVAHIDDC